MSRRIAILAALAAVVAGLWWWSRGGRQPARPAATAIVPSVAVPAPAPTVAELPLPPPSASSESSDVELDDPTPLLTSTHEALHTRARGCWDHRTPRATRQGEPDDTVGRLELKVHVIIEGGRARIDAADVVATRRLREDLRDCIVDQARAATWAVEAPDTTATITELFRMGDYTVPSPARPDFVPPPPPSEAPGR